MGTPLKKRICLVALIGLPAAGKASFCRWLSSLPRRPFSFAHLCYDDVFKMPADISKFAYKAQRLDILNALQTFMDAINGENVTIPAVLCDKLKISLNADSKDYVIACDDNNYYRSMRYKLYQLCRNNQCAYAQINFVCDLSVALQRNAMRSPFESIPVSVLQQMARRLERPDEQNYAWETLTLNLNALEHPEVAANLILTFLSSSFNCIPESLKLQTKCVKTSTSLHRLDLLLRRRITEILQHETSIKVQKQVKAETLNAKRKEILHGLKEDGAEDILGEADFNKYVKLLY